MTVSSGPESRSVLISYFQKQRHYTAIRSSLQHTVDKHKSPLNPEINHNLIHLLTLTATTFSPHGTPLMMVFCPTLAVVGEEASVPAHGAAVHGDARLGEAHAGPLAHAGHHACPNPQAALGGAQVLRLLGGMFNGL